MHLSGPIIATYQELLQRHFRSPPVSVEGSLMLTTRGGSSVWVARKRRGKKVQETYLGVDNEETRAKVVTARQEQDGIKQWSRGCKTLVASLKAAGCPAPAITSARVMAALREIGFFNQGGIISRTQAFQFYPLMFGRLHQQEAQNVPLRLVSTADGNEVAEQLIAHGINLSPIASEDPDHVLKCEADDKIEIEFASEEGEAAFLLEDSHSAVALYRSGVLVNIPDPSRYALHCLLASNQEDWRRAEWLIGVMAEESPYDLYKAHESLRNQFPDSISKLEATLAFMPDTAMILDDILDTFS